MSTLSSKAMLVVLNISQWTARKQDKRAMATVETIHGTDTKAGNYTKKLLPGARELEEISAQAQRIRDLVTRHTLPWYADGTRILASDNYLNFVNEFRKQKTVFDVMVAEFLGEYPALKQAAQLSLGDLFNEIDYPVVERLEEKFRCDLSFMPMPDVSDFRVELGEDEKRRFVDQMKSVEQEAIRTMWTRLHEVTSKAANKLNDPKGIFRNSLIENINELCELLGRMNIANDPTFDQMRQQVYDMTNTLSPDVLRDNPSERDKAAKALQDASDIMSAYMGAN